MKIDYPYTIFFTGECAVNISFGNRIDIDLNKTILAVCGQLSKEKRKYILDIIPAYSSIGILYDLWLVKKLCGEIPASAFIKKELADFLKNDFPGFVSPEQVFRIPVCYEECFSPDTHIIAGTNRISREEIIQLHCSPVYHVFMLGFLPGFAYMGETDARIAIPRKQQPSKKIEAGSIGIAGRQTGIYPYTSPGGWHIIGRTPLTIFDPSKNDPALLKAGNKVCFYSITKDEFEDIKSRNS